MPRSAFQALAGWHPQKAARGAVDATMTLRSPKPSIREMKAAIVRAGLETEDLVERSHVEERYEEALALQPREVDQSSSKAKGMAQAAALKNKAKAEPKARPPSQNESGWWRMEDLSISASHCVETPSRHRRASSPGMMEVGGFFSDFEAVRTVFSEYNAPRRSKAFKKYSEDPSAPEANYFMGKALQMAGQADQADEQYSLFYDRCVAIHQNRDKALKFYEQKIHILKKKQAKAVLRGAEPSVEDAKKLEDYEMMAACLPRVEAERAKRRKKTCVVA